VTDSRTDRVETGLREALRGQYQVEREFARGAMARLFLAKDLRHDRTVVIKVLPPDLATASTAERFLREIRITAVLQHPNILPLLDSGASGALCWYAMPHIEGQSLRHRLAEGPLPVRDALRIAVAVAQALDYAHQRGIIHRDIKPENILFSSGQPMVADFGLARAVAGSHASGITATGLPLGTPAYMSPEQATGAIDVDHRADLYGLGCILYEMLTGQPPFGGRSVMEVIRQHMESVVPTVSSRRPDSPPQLDKLVIKLLAKKPADRYQRAGDVVADLEGVLVRESVDGSVPQPGVGGGTAAAAPPRRRTGLWAAVGGGALLLALLVLWRVGGGSSAISVAVLPLSTIAGDSVARVVAEGFAEELATELVNQGRVRVVSPVSAAALADRGLTTQAIGDSLGVDHIFHGRVIREGNRLRIALELVHLRSEAAEWARAWDGMIGDLLTLRQNVAREASTALQGYASRH
jgi:serine/threonine-protein kinase